MIARPFIVLDGDLVVMSGRVSGTDQVVGDNVVFDVEPPANGRWRYVNGEFVQVPEAPPSVVEGRRDAYPPVADQLDALWHAMDDGVLPRVRGFYEPLKAVKERYPK